MVRQLSEALGKCALAVVKPLLPDQTWCGSYWNLWEGSDGAGGPARGPKVVRQLSEALGECALAVVKPLLPRCHQTLQANSTVSDALDSGCPCGEFLVAKDAVGMYKSCE